MNAKEPSEPSSSELLQRILAAVDSPKRNRNLEIVCAIILALTTTASAWCAYQSKLWGGAQAARGNAAIRVGREQAVTTLTSYQWRAFDASMFITFMDARLATNQAMENFLAQRFRPDMKRAVDAWLKLDPLNNPAAPPSPLHMPEYGQKEAAELERLQTLSDEALQGSRQARQNSDNYVLLTVMFASVLFFGGIARAFDSRALRISLAILAVGLFLATLAGLLIMPVCHE